MVADHNPRWWHRFSTVRARTTILASLAVGVALSIASIGMLVVLESSLTKSIDESADARAEDIAALSRQGVLPRELEDPGDEDAGVQVVDDHDRVVAATENLDGAPRVATFVPPGDDELARTLRDIPGTLNDVVRVLALRSTFEGRDVTIYVITSLEPVWEILGIVRRLLLVGAPLLFALVVVGSWLVVRRALKPVEAIRHEVGEIGASDLSRRVPEPPVHDEIGLLARTMNKMLERLQLSTDRQRRFVGDASHELQSPLATARSELEVALSNPERTDWRARASDLLEENHRMERLVHDLLFLAKTDEARPLPAPVRLDLDDVVMSEVARFRSARGPKIDTAAVSAAPVLGRRGDLTRVVRNLLDNARRHASAGVRLELALDDGHAILRVMDDGLGIPPEMRERIFERFARLDEARDTEHGGSGLGLAIVAEIVDQHHGTIVVDQIAPTGSCFTVRIPAGG